MAVRPAPGSKSTFAKPKTFDRVDIEEATEGMAPRVQQFEIQVKDGDAWKTVVSGTGIGAAYKSPAFPAVTTQALRLNILKASDGPTISEINVSKGK